MTVIDEDYFNSIKLPPGTAFYGTGEVSGQLERTGKRVSFKNNFVDKDILYMLFYLILTLFNP